MAEKDLLSGLVRLHVLYHATCEPIFGQGIIDELARHGYRLSPGTLYPILHGLERGGFLRSRTREDNGRMRRIYVATASGRAALRKAKVKVWELFCEIFEEELSGRAAPLPKTVARKARALAGRP